MILMILSSWSGCSPYLYILFNGEGVLVEWLWEETHDQEVMSSNFSTRYQMDNISIYLLDENL